MSDKAENKGGSYHFEIIDKSVPRDYAATYRLNTDNGVWEKFGDQDNYPDYQLDLYKKSNKHNSIIQTKVNLAVGTGLDYEPLKFRFEKLANGDFRKVEVTMNESQLKTEIEKADAFFYRIGLENRKNFNDLFVHGGGYITLQRSNFTDEAGKNVVSKISKAKHQKFVYGRRGVIDLLSMDQNAEFNYYCKCFKEANKSSIVNFVNYKNNPHKNPVVKLPVYNPDKKGNKFQSLFWGVEDISRDIYPTPDYENKGSLNSIEADYHLSLFDLAESENGMQLEYIIKIFRKPEETPEAEKAKRDKEIKYYKDNFKGTQNANSFGMEWFEPSADFPTIKGVEILEIPKHKDYNYISEKRKSVAREILSAHGVIVSELAGLQGFDAGGFASQADKLQKAFQIFNIQRIKPAQDIYTTKVLDVLMADEGISLKCKIKPHPLVETLEKNELRATVGGLTAMLEIVSSVAEGKYSLEAATALVADRFSLTKEQAAEQLGIIQVIKDVFKP